MKEALTLGAAVLAGIAAFVLIRRGTGGDCLP